jgi:hypothetical protein
LTPFKKQEGKMAKQPHTKVEVDDFPMCDFCDSQASYDGKTKIGPWANMCETHFVEHGTGLGPGKGQRLVLKGTDDKVEVKISQEQRRLRNDLFRRSLGQVGGGRVVITSGVDALPEDTKARILLAVRDFDDFTPDNDPHGEHDFGSLVIDGHTIFWKIDSYDADYRYHGEVNRVLTIMLAEEY